MSNTSISKSFGIVEDLLLIILQKGIIWKFVSYSLRTRSNVTKQQQKLAKHSIDFSYQLGAVVGPSTTYFQDKFRNIFAHPFPTVSFVRKWRTALKRLIAWHNILKSKNLPDQIQDLDKFILLRPFAHEPLSIGKHCKFEVEMTLKKNKIIISLDCLYFNEIWWIHLFGCQFRFSIQHKL